jgi:hypothetical protein
MRSAVLFVILAGCTGVHIDQIAVDDPVVNVDADAEINATANIDATAKTDVDVGTPEQPVAVVSADEQPAKAETPARVVELTAEPAPAAEETPEPELPVCDDADADSVCDSDDVCPGHADTDADDNGHADACEVELWSVNLYFNGSLEFPYAWDDNRPAQVVIQPGLGSDCYLEGEGRGIAYLPVPVYGGTVADPYVVELPRPTESRAGKLTECFEAGVELRAAAYVHQGGGQIVAGQPVPTTAGKHLAYFRVSSAAYWANTLAPDNTTQVRRFHATVTAHGY